MYLTMSLANLTKFCNSYIVLIVNLLHAFMVKLLMRTRHFSPMPRHALRQFSTFFRVMTTNVLPRFYGSLCIFDCSATKCGPFLK